MTVHFDLVESARVSGVDTRIPQQEGFYFGQGKRILDIAFAVATLPIILPVIAGLAILLIATGQKPFYRQDRVGRHGRIFRMWKLRSMHNDAEEALAKHLRESPAARIEWTRHQKLRDDPRITPLGRVLRRTSLDELPQVFNVLSGDMSIVGPRPMLPEQQSLYPGSAYYHIRPGMTGLWQISERNGCEFRNRAEFDQKYARSMGFIEDTRIILSTVGVVLRGTGC